MTTITREFLKAHNVYTLHGPEQLAFFEKYADRAIQLAEIPSMGNAMVWTETSILVCFPAEKIELMFILAFGNKPEVYIDWLIGTEIP
jgi:hypothetical protein